MERAKTGFYASAILGACCIIGSAGFLLFEEMSLSSENNKLINDAIKQLEESDRVKSQLGKGPYAMYGINDGHRRRPVIRRQESADGLVRLDANFFVENRKDSQRKALVTLQTIKNKEGEWKKSYLSVDCEGSPKIIITQPPPVLLKRNGWHPFRSWK